MHVLGFIVPGSPRVCGGIVALSPLRGGLRRRDRPATVPSEKILQESSRLVLDADPSHPPLPGGCLGDGEGMVRQSVGPSCPAQGAEFCLTTQRLLGSLPLAMGPCGIFFGRLMKSTECAWGTGAPSRMSLTKSVTTVN